MEIIYKDRCPECNAANYYNNGDPDDLTISDMDGLICYNCGHKWLFESCAVFDIISAKHAYLVEGKKKEEL